MQGNEFIAHARKDLDKVAHELITMAGDFRLVAFYGEMGVGKTTMIQSVCHALGVKTEVTSPTFALVNEYPVEGSEPVFHFDFYRINQISEALDFGIEEYFGSGCWCLMEWPEKVEELLPFELVRVFLVERPDASRRIRIQVPV